MEGVSLLEKLKTLKQWQLQQQLNFSALKQNTNMCHINDNSDSIENYYSKPPDMLAQTMASKDLKTALQNVEYGKVNMDSDDNGCLRNGEGKHKDLDHWYLSGLSTVVPNMRPTECSTNSYETLSPINNYIVPSESDCETDHIEGVIPLSETDDDELVHQDNIMYHLNNQDNNFLSNNEELVDQDHVLYNLNNRDNDLVNDDDKENEEGEYYYSDEEESYEHTIIEVKDDQIPHDERPIKSKLTGSNYENFEQLVEREIQNNHDDEVILKSVASNKVKNHKFLKRGEGIKRFQYGELKRQQQTAKLKKNKTNAKPRLPLRQLKLKPTQNTNNGIADIKSSLNTKSISQNKQSINYNPSQNPPLISKVKPNRPALKSQKLPRQPLQTNNNINNTVQNQNLHLLEETSPQPSHDVINSKSEINRNRNNFNNVPTTNISTQQKTIATSNNPMSLGENLQKVGSNDSISASMLELSFQKMLHVYSTKEEVEENELDAFEELEEAAENVSLSSNSSLVMKFLGKQNKQDKLRAGSDKILEEPDNEVYDQKQPNVQINDDIAIYDNATNVINKVQTSEFDDEDSWTTDDLSSDQSDIDDTIVKDQNENDDKIIKNDYELNEETIISSNDTSIVSSSPESNSPQMKRIVSKRVKHIDDSNVLTNNIGKDNFSYGRDEEVEPSSTEDIKLVSSPTFKCPTDVSEVVKEKLLQLENEIKKFRNENEILAKLRIERETDLKTLRTEIETFQRDRSEELKRIEEYRETETKKIKTERKVFDKYQKAARAVPNKKERDEIKMLQEQCEELKEELKSRDSRWNSATHRFRSRINELEEQNNELKNEIKILEQERIQRWKQEEQKIENKKKVQRSPTTTTTNVTNNVHYRSLEYDTSPSNYPELRKNVIDIDILPRHQMKNTYNEQEVKKQQLSSNNDIVNNTGMNFKQTYRQNETDDECEREDHLKTHINEEHHVEPHIDDKIEMIQADGSRLITFPNGTKKTISSNGQEISVMFFNGDIKKVLADKSVIYYYAESKTSHTTLPDGTEMLQFPNEQIEKRYPDGRTEIKFPDNTVKLISVDGLEETIFPDGTRQQLDKNGARIITFTNGQKEIHTKTYKRREYPNGTIKTVYEDGRQETKYSSGRLRVKDKNGKLLIDSYLNTST